MTTLGALEKVDLRQAWATEAQHFTPWLASDDGLKLLSDTLGVELVREAEEQPVGPFRADILARRTDTPEEHWVLIENQLERTDHNHLGQLMTYAAGLQAATIIWVAERFTDEHRAALDWLNQITNDRFEFYGLELELWRIGDSSPAPKLNLVARPNDWSRVVQSAADRDAHASPLRQQQLRYWRQLGDLLEARRRVRPQTAKAQSWAAFAIGRTGTWLAASVSPRKRYIGVELVLRGPPGKVWFENLLVQKAEIEMEVGAKLDWDPMPAKKQSRIALYRHNTDPGSEGEWPSQHEWLATTIEAFHRAFSTRVKALPGDDVVSGEFEDVPQ